MTCAIASNGCHSEKSFKRKFDAVKFRATVEAELARGDWIDERLSEHTVAEYAEAWFATLGDGPNRIKFGNTIGYRRCCATASSTTPSRAKRRCR